LCGGHRLGYQIIFTKQAKKDSEKIEKSNLKFKTIELLKVIAKSPFQNPPPYEKLIGSLHGAYSRRINIQHRLVYEVFEAEMKVKVLKMWTHYE
jgi:toxin YoeB